MSHYGYPLSPQQAHILEEFNGQTYEPNRMDVQAGHLWDSISLPAGATLGTSSKLFSNEIGSYGADGLIKTTADTNMHTRCQLGAPEAFSISRVVFTFSRSSSDHDVFGIAERVYWKLILGNRRYLGSILVSLNTLNHPVAPFRVCDFCKSVYVQDVTCPGCGASQFSLGSGVSLGGEAAGRQFFMDVRPRIVIDAQASFSVDLECNPPFTVQSDFKMWCHLEGLHARGVC